ncbi:MAG: energy-coupling factor transporter transmembrane protein EcfT, partial [Mailhella sp.]
LLMLRLLFTPLLFRSLRTSEELGIAAELKGLEAGSRFVPLRTHAWSGMDSMLIVLALMASIAALYVNSVAGTAVSAAMH